MSIQIAIEEKQDYLRVEVSGQREKDPDTLEDAAKEFWLNIFDMCKAKGVSRILAVMNLTGELPVSAAYDLGTWVAKIEELKKLRIAVVDLNDRSRENNEFIELVASNRGQRGVGRVFENEVTALEWLLA